jgi:hypothetical protein
MVAVQPAVCGPIAQAFQRGADKVEAVPNARSIAEAVSVSNPGSGGDRCLRAVRESGARPVVLLTKADLCEDASDLIQEVQSVAGDAAIHAVSVVSGLGLDLVRGYLTQNPHRLEFWDDGCERGFLPEKLSPGTAEGRQLRSKVGSYIAQSNRRPPQVPVVYSGTFTDHSPALVCDGLCSQFTLDTAELVAVRRD